MTDVAQPNGNPVPARSCRAETTILLVDDDHDVLNVLKALLTYEGYTVITAACPALALELAATNAFGMLITDYRMPEINGVSLASRLVATRVSLPVLLISGSDVSELPMSEIAAHHWNFMSKPIDRARLLEIVDGECLGRVLQRG